MKTITIVPRTEYRKIRVYMSDGIDLVEVLDMSGNVLFSVGDNSIPTKYYMNDVEVHTV